MQSQVILAVFALVQFASAIRPYADKIPNAFIVPNPCGGTWDTLGHYVSGGGAGTGNGFGWMFSILEKNWIKLCPNDYDRDGKTNGEEMGDPKCVWTPGSTPAGKPTGNPVVCEPVNDPKCKGFNNRIWATDRSRLPCFTGASTKVAQSIAALFITLCVSMIRW